MKIFHAVIATRFIFISFPQRKYINQTRKIGTKLNLGKPLRGGARFKFRKSCCKLKTGLSIFYNKILKTGRFIFAVSFPPTFLGWFLKRCSL